MAIIAPSLLACNFLQLENECIMVNNSEADWFHLDVMDGRFVPNISFGLPVIQQINKVATKPLDVHLMIVEPDQYIDAFKNAGADILSVHAEACIHLHRTVQYIKQQGMMAGVAINPHTSLDCLQYILEDIDLVCMMSVNPGFGGQKFIPHTYTKIKQLRRMIDERNLKVDIEIDGGVTEYNAAELIAAGATVLVAGNTVFSAADPIDMIKRLKSVS